MLSCLQCGGELPENARFCPGCGAAVEMRETRSEALDVDESEDAGPVTCRQCGEELPEGVKFCSSCGASVEPGEALLSSPPTDGGRTVSEVSGSERNTAMLCHLLSFAGIFIPFGNIAGPLIAWLTQRENSLFIDAHGKESINFQLSVTIYSFVGVVLLIVGAILVIILVGILVLVVVGLLMLALFAFSVIVVIVAAVRAGNGEEYRYPLSIRFLR
jgi:uncharacterized Tic20 family protein